MLAKGEPMSLTKLARVSGLLWLLAASGAGAEVVTVVAAGNPVTTLSRGDVANIFLGKTRQFPDGSPVQPIDQPESSPIRQTFYRTIGGQRPEELKAYWSKMIFTGRGQPPPVVQGDEAVKEALAHQRGSIGYIDANAVDSRVRVVPLD